MRATTKQQKHTHKKTPALVVLQSIYRLSKDMTCSASYRTSQK